MLLILITKNGKTIFIYDHKKLVSTIKLCNESVPSIRLTFPGPKSSGFHDLNTEATAWTPLQSCDNLLKRNEGRMCSLIEFILPESWVKVTPKGREHFVDSGKGYAETAKAGEGNPVFIVNNGVPTSEALIKALIEGNKSGYYSRTYQGNELKLLVTDNFTFHNIDTKETNMQQQSFVQSAAKNLTETSKSVVTDAIDVATGMAAVEAIKQIAFSIMPVKVGFMGTLMGQHKWIRNNAFVTLGLVTVVHTILKSSKGKLTVNDSVMEVADNALCYATFKAVESFPINKLIQDLSEKLTNLQGK